MSYKGGKKSNVYESEEGYNLYASQYKNDWGYLDSFEKDVILRFLGNLDGKKILDVGCGNGRMFSELMKRNGEVVGADVSAEMLKLAGQKFPRVKLAQAAIEKLPFEDNSFDFVVAFFVIVHVRDLVKAFDEVYRVLKPGGSFILSNINQRKAPKLKTKNGQEIVINSFNHRPDKVLEALDRSFFKIDKEEFVEEDGTWINQIVKATH